MFFVLSDEKGRANQRYKRYVLKFNLYATQKTTFNTKNQNESKKNVLSILRNISKQSYIDKSHPAIQKSKNIIYKLFNLVGYWVIKTLKKAKNKGDIQYN